MCVHNEDISNIESSINLRNKTKLIIENCELSFSLNEDLEVSIYLYGDSEIIIDNNKIHSNEKMWELS